MEKYKEIEALLKLLDDDDQYIITTVSSKIKEYIPQISLDIWRNFSNNISEKAKKRLENIFEDYNRNYVLLHARNWLKNPAYLTEGLFLISRIFDPFLTYSDFLKNIFLLKRHFPNDFKDNYTPLEIADYTIYVFYKLEEFRWHYESAVYTAFLPDVVLQTHKGSHITLGLLIVALLQHLGINWLLVSDVKLLVSLVVVMSDWEKLSYFFIEPRNGTILTKSPISRNELQQVILKNKNKINALSLKSLVVALLQPNVIPRELDDKWQLLNQLNTMMAITN